MKTTDMKVLMHSKGTLYVMNLNDDNFRFSRLFFPPWGGFFFLNRTKVVSYKVRRKNVDGSAERRLAVGKELGDHWGQPPQEAKV